MDIGGFSNRFGSDIFDGRTCESDQLLGSRKSGLHRLADWFWNAVMMARIMHNT